MSHGEKPSVVVTFKRNHLIIGGILLLFLIGAAVLIFNWKSWFGEQPSSAKQPDIDSGAVDWSGEPLENKGGASTGIAIPGYPSITIPAHTKNVQAVLLNPEGNPCYFTFEILLSDTGESLYKSKQVPPGKAVTELILTRGLSSGEYDAVIQITTASMSDLSPMNGAEVKTVLIVQ